MAMPAATGIDGTSGRASSSTRSCWVLPPIEGTLKTTTVTTLADTNHLSCWRSIPWLRLKRIRGAATQASPHTSISQNAPLTTVARAVPNSAWSSSESRAGPRRDHDAVAKMAGISTIGSAEAQATGRQRREGSRPSGNSRGTKVIRQPAPGAHAQPLAQSARSPPGSEPGAVASA
jgi:hypothetical protein